VHLPASRYHSREQRICQAPAPGEQWDLIERGTPYLVVSEIHWQLERFVENSVLAGCGDNGAFNGTVRQRDSVPGTGKAHD
jgi:hypothetical protein